MDKGSRASDLLSDGGNFSLKTVVFGCGDMLKKLTGVSTFNVVLDYQDPIQANVCGADRLYAAQIFLSHLVLNMCLYHLNLLNASK